MKTKKFGKKLNFNKETVVNLDTMMMKNIVGGDPYSQFKTLCMTNCSNCGTNTCDTCLLECTYTTSIPGVCY
jgi:hypothetical protein